MGIFGTKKQPAPVRPGPPPMSLNNCSEHLDSKVQGLDQKIAETQAELKSYQQQMKQPSARNNPGLKMRALNLLRRKKMYEQQRDQLMNTQFNVDQAAFTTENMAITAQTVDSMKSAQKTMQSQMTKIDVDEIAEMQDDMADVYADMAEVQETMGRMYGVPAEFNEAELDAEFAAMEADDMSYIVDHENPSYIPSGFVGEDMPSAPVAHASAPVKM